MRLCMDAERAGRDQAGMAYTQVRSLTAFPYLRTYRTPDATGQCTHTQTHSRSTIQNRQTCQGKLSGIGNCLLCDGPILIDPVSNSDPAFLSLCQSQSYLLLTLLFNSARPWLETCLFYCLCLLAFTLLKNSAYAITVPNRCLFHSNVYSIERFIK